MFRVDCSGPCNVTIAGIELTGGRAPAGPNATDPAGAGPPVGNESEAAAACGGAGAGGGGLLVVGRGEAVTAVRVEGCAITNCSARCGGGILVRTESVCVSERE